jgi:spermidine synthase
MERRKTIMTRVLLLVLGMTAMATQVIMIRESLAIFQGNELIIGLFLAIWMLLTAVGAYVATRFRGPGYELKVPFFKSKIENRKSEIENRKSKIENDSSPLPRFPASLLVLLTFLPLITLVTLIILRYSIVPSGIMPGPGLTIVIIFIALLPFCLVSGMLFPIQIQHLSALRGINALYEGYALDSAGSILGGLLFSMLFIFVLPPYESLILITLIWVIIIIVWLFVIKRKIIAISLLAFSILLIFLNYTYEPACFLDDLQFNKQEVIEIKSSPYGMNAVTRIGEQFFIYENGIPVNVGDDPVSREESVHYTMLLHPLPEKLLVFSGGTSGIIEETLKYPVLKVDYVEINPWLLRMAGKYRPLPDDKRVNYAFEDPRIFLSKNDEKYDIILINTPEPNSAAQNRFYTVEFYNLLKSRLSPGGLLSMSVPAAGNYMSKTSRQLHSVACNTLKTVFSHVRVIPGAKDYFLASDSTIEQSIFRDFQSKGIGNNYVNPFYINEDLLKMRSDLIMKDILPDTQINSDLKPFVFSLYLKQWLERYKINSWLIPLILILILILSMIFLGPLNLGLFTGGFTASGLEFILLLWLQVIYGFVYKMIGVIFAIFMAGIVTGSFFQQKIIRKHTLRKFLIIQLSMAIFSVLVAFFIHHFTTSPLQNLTMMLIMILVFISGLLMGIQFSLSSRLRKTIIVRSAGESFSADLLGSAIGVMVVSVYLVPQFGLPVTATLLAGLNLLAMGAMFAKR